MDIIALLFIALLIIGLIGCCIVLNQYIKAGREANQIEILQAEIARLDSIRKVLAKSLLMDLYRRKLD